jgi:hypothetical protein
MRAVSNPDFLPDGSDCRRLLIVSRNIELGPAFLFDSGEQPIHVSTDATNVRDVAREDPPIVLS